MMGLSPVKHAEKKHDLLPKKPRKFNKVTTAARAGSVIGTLETMRDRLAKAIDDKGTAPRDLAALTKRLWEITAEIEKLKTQEDQSSEVVSLEAVDDAPFSAEAI